MRRFCVFGLGMIVVIIGSTLLLNVSLAQHRGKKTPVDLLTVAERYNYRAAAKSDFVVKYLDRVAKRAPHIHRFSFGKTVEGRPMVAAVAAKPAITRPEQLRNDKRLVVLVIGNIHSGECCGQEALLKMLRELLLQPNHRWMRNLVLIFVPNYNADGNDKRSPKNRPGQVGPAKGMGQRANAQGFDLNRDYVKLESPEARALIDLMNRWQPHCFIDCHTTNGSWHRYQLTYDVQHNPAADSGLFELMRGRMMPTVTKRLLKNKIDTFYYGNFNKNMTGWYTYGHQPRYGLDYVALRGRLSILSEAYAYITFRERIYATHAFVSECLTFLNDNAKLVRQKVQAAERRTIAAGNNPKANDVVPIRAVLGKFPQAVAVKGYDPPWQPRLKPANIVPGVRPAPPGKPKDYTVDFFGRFTPTQSVQRPVAYVIPAKLGAIIDKLRQHGIKLNRLVKDTTLPVEIYRWKALKKSPRPFQKHRMARASVTSYAAKRRVPKGAYIARTGQPLGNLLIYLLEPESDDGLVTWNYFDKYYQAGRDFPVLRIRQPQPLLEGLPEVK